MSLRAKPETSIAVLQQRALKSVVAEADHWIWTGAGSKTRNALNYRMSGKAEGSDLSPTLYRIKPWPIMRISTSFGTMSINPAALWLVQTPEEYAAQQAYMLGLDDDERRRVQRESIEAAPVVETDALTRFKVRNVCGDTRCLNPAHNVKMDRSKPLSHVRRNANDNDGVNVSCELPFTSNDMKADFSKARWVYGEGIACFIVAAWGPYRWIVYDEGYGLSTMTATEDELIQSPNGVASKRRSTSMDHLKSILSALTTVPIEVAIPADELRRHITDPEIVIEPVQTARIYRRATTPADKPRVRVQAASVTIPVTGDFRTDIPVPVKCTETGGTGIYGQLWSLPLDGKTSLWLPGDTHRSISQPIAKASQKHRRTYTVGNHVSDGVKGVRVWRVT